MRRALSARPALLRSTIHFLLSIEKSVILEVYWQRSIVLRKDVCRPNVADEVVVRALLEFRAFSRFK